MYPNKYEDFSFCMNSCKLFNINFKESHLHGEMVKWMMHFYLRNLIGLL